MLAKLPPLPKRPSQSTERRERLATNLLKRLPTLGEWGGLEVGRWAETKAGDATEVVGRCAKCGEITNAVALKLRRIPFTNEEQWECADCEGN